MCFKRKHETFRRTYHVPQSSSSAAQISGQPPKLCAYCKNVGHHINDCRKREYNNQRRANQFQGNPNSNSTSQNNAHVYYCEEESLHSSHEDEPKNWVRFQMRADWNFLPKMAQQMLILVPNLKQILILNLLPNLIQNVLPNLVLNLLLNLTRKQIQILILNLMTNWIMVSHLVKIFVLRLILNLVNHLTLTLILNLAMIKTPMSSKMSPFMKHPY